MQSAGNTERCQRDLHNVLIRHYAKWVKLGALRIFALKLSVGYDLSSFMYM